MRDELEKHLFAKYHDLLIDLPYIGVGDGWFLLLSNMLSELHKFDVKLIQIKEKFGSLRVYCNINELSDTDCILVNNIIAKYETLSNSTCEECGSPGKRVSCHNWLRVLCEDHYRKFQEKHGG